MKTIWRKNFDIRRTDYNLAVETMPGFGGLNHITVGKNIVSKAIWVVKDMDNEGTFFPKDELRKLIRLTIDEILTNPRKIARIHRKATTLNRQYFSLAKAIRQFDIPRLTDKQLLSWRNKLFQIQYISHCWALPTTWYLDSDGEDFSRQMTNFLTERIEKLKLDLEPATAYSILSTPAEESLASIEEKESLKILTWIRSRPRLKHWFMNNTTEELAAQFPKLQTAWKNKLNSHFQKWLWLPYTYIGPAYNLDYFLEVWRGLLHEDIDPKAKLSELASKSHAIQKQRAALISQLKLSKLEQDWFNTAADIVWLKGYRKDAFFHGFFVLDSLLKEIGKRSNLSLIQTKYLLPKELPQALQGKNFSNIANERIKFSVIYTTTPKGKNYTWTGRTIKVFTGQTAKNFLKKHTFEKIKIIKTSELTGSCACPGSASGTIKIINVPDEMPKMQQGDIMLSHTTFPALVPAMKKAAAIITEDGGITCHAAIVARELQTPCVVGCKNALAILKDGDKVEVDANKGIIKRT